MIFFMTTKEKQVLPPMFYLINIESVTPYVYFMTADKKGPSYPSWFFHVDQSIKTVPPLSTFLRGSEHELSVNLRVLTSELNNAPSRHRIKIFTKVILDFIIHMK